MTACPRPLVFSDRAGSTIELTQPAAALAAARFLVLDMLRGGATSARE